SQIAIFGAQRLESRSATMFRRARALGFAVTTFLLALAADVRAGKPEPSANLRSGPIAAADWKKAATTPLQPGEIDRLLAAEQKAAGVSPAPLTTDEQFIRRVHLDVTGKLPSPSAVLAFVADKDA